MIPNYSMIPAAAIRWSPGIRWSPAIWWSPAIRWSIKSMDFDNRKVYGDNSITDGLVEPNKVRNRVDQKSTFVLPWSVHVRMSDCHFVRLSTRHPPGFPLGALSGCKRRHLQAQDEGRRPEEAFAPPCRGKQKSCSTGLINNITCNQAFCLSLVLPSQLQFHQQTWSTTSVFLIMSTSNPHLDPWPGAPGICTSNQYSFLSP